MKSALISVGTEILFGQIVNTNAVYLSRKLNELGIDVMYHFTVGDNPQRLQEVLNYALKDVDLILTTGGLGPTQDDLTKEVISETMNEELALHDESFEKIEKFFKKINKKMSENNIKQAFLPNNCVLFPNDLGTAPGFAIEKNDKIVAAMPGPPREMSVMFESYVEKYLKSKSQDVIYSKIIRFFGIGESSLETELLDLISNQTNPTLATYAKSGEVTLRVTAKSGNQQESERLVNETVAIIDQRLNQYIYSHEDKDLVEVIVEKLIEKDISISVAESCTGGLIASKLTTIPGVSQVFNRGLVTYSNQAKMEELGVAEKTLLDHGAVSEETAIEMIKGLKRVSQSDICISVTGIAGPGGATEEKPVGLVYIALMHQDQLVCKSYHLPGNRDWNREHITLLVFDMIRKLNL